MYIKRNFNFWSLFVFSGFHIVWLSLWGLIAYYLYYKFHFKWMALPWLPISLIGIAVSFYVGFKNNSSYDRLWEARKIWGAIVNTSRSWGTVSRNFISNQFTAEDHAEEEMNEWRKRLIYRHLAWLMTLRKQLLKPATWEHVAAKNFGLRRLAQRRRDKSGIGLFDKISFEEEVSQYLSEEQLADLNSYKNGATHLLDVQSEDLKKLRALHLIDDFRHMEMQALITDLYTQQGKCERIKNFPLPRQYASMSTYFIGLFIVLLPFGILPQFESIDTSIMWMAIPVTTVVGWVFVMMEIVGDWSENPFEGLGNDVPMKSLVNTIEIDLREMIQDDNIPEKLQPVNNIMM